MKVIKIYLLLAIVLLSGCKLNVPDKNIAEQNDNRTIEQEQTSNEEIKLKSDVGNGFYNQMEYYVIEVKGEKLGLNGEIPVTKIINLLGKPNREREWKTAIYGLHKEMIYKGIKLLMIDPDENGQFIVIEIEVTSEEYPTLHGIKVGNEINYLTEIYPDIKKNDDGTYSFHNEAIYNTLFEIKDGKVAFIKLYTELP
jgi:hypothetical protein